MQLATRWDCTARTYAEARTLVSTGSSAKHSKFRPPMGVRWRLTVGARCTWTPRAAASLPSTPATSATVTGSHVAPSAAPHGTHADLGPDHEMPRIPFGPSLMRISPTLPIAGMCHRSDPARSATFSSRVRAASRSSMSVAASVERVNIGGTLRKYGHGVSTPPDEDRRHIDYRFSLANERTFLAWNRTALALVAGGLAVVQLLDAVESPTLRRALGVPMVVLGGVIAALSFSRWERNEEAMHEDRALPASLLPRLLAVGVTVGGVIALVLVLVADVG